MALLHIDIRSKILTLQTHVDAIIPETRCPREDGLWPVLYLLHGLTNDNTSWQRYTNIERYAEEQQLAVIMPSLGRSFCTNMLHGEKYWTYLCEELPMLCSRMFRISQRREDTFAAGLSMGGYGAIKLALLHPEKYCAAASLSGALDIVKLMKNISLGIESTVLTNVFGSIEQTEGTENDLLFDLEKLSQSHSLRPRLMAVCGLQDELLPLSRAFKEKAEQMNVALTYAEITGDHTWNFWEKELPQMLKWITKG